MGDLINNRGYANVDAGAGASVHGWVKVLEQIAAGYPADALYVYGHAEAGHPFIGTRQDLLYQRDYFTAVIAAAGRARKEGRSREDVLKMDVLAGFEHFGGTKARLGLALALAYDELAKMG
jgi:cyclase